MLKHVLLGVGLLAAAPAFAQTASPVPATYTLKAPADYVTYQSQVIETVNWLGNPTTPFGTPERAAAAKFLLEYVSGSPTVSVTIEPYVMKLTNSDPDLLTAFFGGWARYSLQNTAEKNAVTLNTEAVKNVLTVYKNKGGRGNKEADDLLKREAQGKLPDWVKSHVSSK